MFGVCTGRLATVFLMSGLMAIAGCGDSAPPRPVYVPVSGKVVFKGAPLANASVTFLAPGAPEPGTGLTNDSGEFSTQALPGENIVMISVSAAEESAPMDPSAMLEGGGGSAYSGTIDSKARCGSSKGLRQCTQPVESDGQGIRQR